MPMYELKTGRYQGPLDTLLMLVEERKLEINEINLAEVTEDFLKYLEALKNEVGTSGSEEWMRTIADFLVVASRLLLIKSKSLIPELRLTAEEEEGIRDLEARLKLHKELRAVWKSVQTLYKSRSRSFGRAYMADALGLGGFFYPGENLTIDELYRAVSKLKETVESFIFEEETVKKTIISLEEKIEEVLARLAKEVEASFSSFALAKTKAEVIVLFLAILHLARDQRIILEQEGYFSDIMIKKK